MKKLFVAIAGIVCATALTVHAADDSTTGKKHHKMTDEQKTVQKEMVDKYDTNKDGKLDKEERSKMSQEDKDKYQKAFGGHHHKKEASQ